MSIEVDSTNVDITTNTELVVDTKVTDVKVVTEEGKVAEVQPTNFVLTSGGLYTGNLQGDIPVWLATAVESYLTTGDGNIADLVSGLQILTSNLQAGVDQNITSISNTNLSLNALETSVTSRLDENASNIIQLDTTKVTATEALAISTNLLTTTFNGDVNAYIGSIASTYVDENSAIAQDVDIVAASVNDVTASVTEISTVSVDEGEARAKHSLTVDANGNISGYVAESGLTSKFTILADKFEVANGVNPGLVPFSVDTLNSKVVFNGVVDFTNTNIVNGYAGTTTINGGLITTATVSTNQLAADIVTVGQEIKSSDFTTIGGAGFRLKSNAADTLADPTIYGAYIRGGAISSDTTITADSITAGTLTVDVINSGDLTSTSSGSYSNTTPGSTLTVATFSVDNSTGTGVLIVINGSGIPNGYVRILKSGAVVAQSTYQEGLGTRYHCATFAEGGTNVTYTIQAIASSELFGSMGGTYSISYFKK